MTLAAPSRRSIPALAAPPHVATTRQPAAAASWTTNWPVPPAAAVTTTAAPRLSGLPASATSRPIEAVSPLVSSATAAASGCEILKQREARASESSAKPS